MGEWIRGFFSNLGTYGMRIFSAALIAAIGWWVARFLSRLLGNTLVKGKVDHTLANFCKNLCYVILLVFVAIAVLNKLGVETTSLAVVIGAIALAIGFALQGALANFAAGIMLIMFKPFRSGDLVEIAGNKGTLVEIQLFNTILNSPDNVRIIIPNGRVTGNNIMNYTVNGILRIDLLVRISYEDELKKAKETIDHVLTANNNVLGDPKPCVTVCELGENSVNLAVRPWVNAEDYWQVYYEITEQIKLELEDNNISIPYPHRQVQTVQKRSHAMH